jgi:hypothetical protein
MSTAKREEIAARLKKSVSNSRHYMVLRKDGTVDIKDVQAALGAVAEEVAALLAELDARVAKLEASAEESKRVGQVPPYKAWAK